MEILLAGGATVAVFWLVGCLVPKCVGEKKDDFYGPTTGDEEVNYYAHDERGQDFLQAFHEDYRRLL